MLKRSSLLTIVCCLLVVSSSIQQLLRSTKSPNDYKYPFEIMSKDDLPKEFSWGNKDGRNYLTRMKNQHIPQYCGSCWAFASTSMMSDRISIMRDNAFPEINIAPQTLLDFDYVDQGCHGGDLRSAFEYIVKNGIVDESCTNYRARGWEETDGLANVQPRCKDCHHGTCIVPKHNEYTVEKHGEIPATEEAIMSEIYNNGPVGCGVNSTPIHQVPYGFTGVFETDIKGEINHAISLVGWGVEKETGKPYWLMRNSWGEYFADGGFIKIFRGNNTMNIEAECYFAIPKNTWSKQNYPNTGDADRKIQSKVTDFISVLNNQIIEDEVALKVKTHGPFKGSYKKSELKAEHIVNPLPQDTISDDQLPARFWWGDVDNTNYLSWTVNQHIPTYCGSCWAQAAAGAMSDRINIKHKNLSRRSLSTQALINCAVGTCAQGGDANDVYNYAFKNGIPEYGCYNYNATDPTKAECSDYQKCMDCPGFGKGPCFEKRKYTAWKAKEFGRVKGASNMKKEIWVRGPIACLFLSTNKFYYGYKGGIYSEKVDESLESNHVVNITGWGKTEEGQEFWIVRNSWGTYWGENGYFRLAMGEGSMKIEEDCDWAVPEMTVIDLDAEPKKLLLVDN